MLDDSEKTQRLMAALEAAVPIEAMLSPQTRRSLSVDDPAIPSSGRCTIVSVLYLGDYAGITCTLDFGNTNPTTAHLVSITHLIFNANTPHYREIDAYQRHRTKKLRKQGNLEPGSETFTPTRQ